ncbi:hypothetical protein [Microbacterium sp. NPDC057650]|uniref:hypothetical protein n=1 Tax=unclassified Microbacterium TaxID=2609290 RepID=UPI00366B346D
MSTADLGHGRGWLRADAAASLRRIDRQIGHPLQITWAGRSPAEQQKLIDKWQAGEGAYAAPIDESPHPMGIAIDTDEGKHIADIMTANGWRRPLKKEPWHWTYALARDTHRNDPAPAAQADAPEPKEIEMYGIYNTDDKNEKTRRALVGEFTFQTISAWFSTTQSKTFYANPRNVTQEEWDATKELVNQRRASAGMTRL